MYLFQFVSTLKKRIESAGSSVKSIFSNSSKEKVLPQNNTLSQPKVWRLWAKSLGQKASESDKEADEVAKIRTVILLTYFITNCFIVAGVIRHWNDEPTNNYYIVPISCPGSNNSMV